MNQFLMGAVALGLGVAGLFFLRFWKDTRDRLFGFFALAFFVLAVNRACLALAAQGDAARDHFYWVRLLAFLLILVAIWDKNRSPRSPGA